jgi:cytochrome P450 family 103
MSITLDATPLDEAELPFLDVESAAFAADPWTTIEAARDGGGRLLRSQRGIELIAYDPLGDTLQDKRLRPLHSDYWAEHGAGPRTLSFLDHGHLLTFAPDRHLRVRRKMVAAFQMSKIDQQRAAFHEIGHRLVDGFVDTGRCDVVWDFTHHYSIEILCRLVGVPAADIPTFAQATLDLTYLNARPFEPVADQLEQALSTLWDYSADIVARRRAAPEADFISSMLVSEQEGALSEEEVTWGVANLLFAGHDTTRYQLASIVRALIEHDAWDAVAADPTLSAVAVEEGLRLYPVTLLLTRVVVGDDFVLEGVHLPPGTIVRANMMGTTRDPARFAAADRFDLQRDRGRTVPFGQGVHKCIGHALARADMEAAVEILTSRITDVAVAPTGVDFQPVTGALWGPTHLPITFREAAA